MDSEQPPRRELATCAASPPKSTRGNPDEPLCLHRPRSVPGSLPLPPTFSTLPVGCAAPPLAKRGGLSRSRLSLGPALAHQPWPRTKQPATGVRDRGLWRSLLRDLGPGVGAAVAVESWPQRKGPLGHTRADRRGARTHGPTDRQHPEELGRDPVCWGRHLRRRGVVGAAETRPRCPLGLGGAAAEPSLPRRVTCGPERPRDQGGPGSLAGGPEPCPGGKRSLLPGRALGNWSPAKLPG